MLADKIRGIKSIPFHTPGHKRNTQLLGNSLPYELDITEIDGFDNLHNPQGVIKEIETKLSEIYVAKHSYALVNGSTVGILAGVNALVREGDTVLMARNCHKSVYNAVCTAKARTEYIVPETDEYGLSKGITAAHIEDRLSENIKLVVLTSPTYEGFESEVDEICELCHDKNIPVLIDAAHGACIFDSYRRADIVIRSLHKTLPAMTQCAVANIYGNLIDEKLFRYELSKFETSSPSYVLLSSIDECAEFIKDNKILFENYNKLVQDFRTVHLNNLKLVENDDKGKIVIFTGYSDISGFELARRLRDEFQIEIELAAENHVIALTSVCDTEQSLNALKYALSKIDGSLAKSSFNPKQKSRLPKKSLEVFEALPCSSFNITDCVGKTSAEYIWAYPPGIPLIAPGEVFDNEIVDAVAKALPNLQSTYTELPRIYCTQSGGY